MTHATASRPRIVAPIPLEPNRVSRFYRGGALLDAFRSGAAGGPREPGADGDRPEDWLASIVRAWTPVGKPISDEGLTRVRVGDDEVTLRDLVQRRDPAAIGGAGLVRAAGPTSGLLVKLLDAAQRLPVHCHPSRPFAERFLGSRFGKTEAWLVMGTRQLPTQPPPCVWLGFRRDVARDELRGWIDEGDSEALLGALHQRTVAPGDAWFVPAGTPHAIGAGVFLVELQEPTDFSVVAETSGFPIDRRDAHLGQGWDVMVDCFDRRGISDADLERLRHAPEVTPTAGGLHRERLLGRAADPFFRAERLTLAAGDAPLPWADTFVVGVVTDGGGRIATPAGSIEVGPGSSFAVPAAISHEASLAADDRLVVLCCLPPEGEALAATGWRASPGPEQVAAG